MSGYGGCGGAGRRHRKARQLLAGSLLLAGESFKVRLLLAGIFLLVGVRLYEILIAKVC